MAMDLLPFRQYGEEDVINGIFRFSGVLPANKGTVVTAQSGWVVDRNNLDFLGSVGKQHGDTVSEIYGIQPAVRTANTGDTGVLGILLYDVKETDENGEKFRYHREKAAANDITISGEASPVVTRGIFLVSGIVDGVPAVNSPIYASGGEMIVTQPLTVIDNCTKIGKCLGPKSSKGWTLIKLEL